MKNAIEFFEVAFGCSKVDAVLVPMNWRLAAPEIEAILADAEPAVLVADAEHAESLVGLVATGAAARVAAAAVVTAAGCDDDARGAQRSAPEARFKTIETLSATTIPDAGDAATPCQLKS